MMITNRDTKFTDDTNSDDKKKTWRITINNKHTNWGKPQTVYFHFSSVIPTHTKSIHTTSNSSSSYPRVCIYTSHEYVCVCVCVPDVVVAGPKNMGVTMLTTEKEKERERVTIGTGYRYRTPLLPVYKALSYIGIYISNVYIILSLCVRIYIYENYML